MLALDLIPNFLELEVVDAYGLTQFHGDVALGRGDDDSLAPIAQGLDERNEVTVTGDDDRGIEQLGLAEDVDGHLDV